MKSQDEIQRAHDILHFVALEGAATAPDGQTDAALHAAHDALSWVLGFPCGETFQINLDTISKTLEEAGFEEIDAGKPISHEEAVKRGITS